MSVSASARPLIIGIGNPLRSDDGLGWAVAEQLSQAIGADYDIRTVHQLTPELALWIAQAEFVVMIDAHYMGEPGALVVRPVACSAQPGAVGSHHTTPEELVALTTALYERCPSVTLVTMTGANFGMGEHLSTVVAERIPRVCAAIHEVCRRHSSASR